MNCKNCGEPLEHGTLFCENCGARAYPNAAHASDEASAERLIPSRGKTRKAEQIRTKKRLKRLIILFCAVSGVSLLAILFIVFRQFILPGKASAAASSQTASVAAMSFASPDEQTAYWQSAYTPFLEQLVSKKSAGTLCASMIDINFDGIPELFDLNQTYDAAQDFEYFYIDVYYLNGSAVEQLGSAAIYPFNDEFMPLLFCFDYTNQRYCFLSYAQYESGSLLEENITEWGSLENGSLACKIQYAVHGRSSADQFDSSLPKDAVFYQPENSMYYIASFQNKYLRSSVLVDEYKQYLSVKYTGSESGLYNGFRWCANNNYIYQGYDNLLYLTDALSSGGITKQIFSTYTDETCGNAMLIQQAVQLFEQTGSWYVYFDENSSFYHYYKSCSALSAQNDVQSILITQAILKGLTPCPECAVPAD